MRGGVTRLLFVTVATRRLTGRVSTGIREELETALGNGLNGRRSKKEGSERTKSLGELVTNPSPLFYGTENGFEDPTVGNFQRCNTVVGQFEINPSPHLRPLSIPSFSGEN